MLPSRAFAIAALTLCMGSAFALINPYPVLSQTIPQEVNPSARPERRMPQWIQQLNLSQEQMQRMREIQNQYKDRMAQSMRSLSQARQELQTMMAGTASQNELRDKHRQVESLGQQLRQLQFESTIAIREILTPEQRRVFAQRMQHQGRNPNNRPGNRRGMSPPEATPPGTPIQ